MKTNELKKGTPVRLANGLEAILADNRLGPLRTVTILEPREEHGSIFAHDIVAAHIDGKWIPIELTRAQLKERRLAEYHDELWARKAKG